jgi:hypothetical protein
MAPRSLGRRGELFLQEALSGQPLDIEPLSPGDAAEIRWTAAHASVAAGFVRLARATSTSRAPTEIDAPVERALASGLLSARASRRVREAWQEIRAREVAVLRHRDASPQNCLLADGALDGVVDWENATPTGAPGFDVLNFAVAVVEAGVGLSRWKTERVVEAMRLAWTQAPFGRDARAAAGAAATAAGFPASDLEALELVFFARRLGQRLANPGAWAVDPESAARMTEIACAR